MVKKFTAHFKCLVLLGLALLFFFSAISQAAENDEPITYQGKTYDISYFFAISGEVYGQAAPGVEAVLVNNKPIKVEADRTFKAQVFLKEGQKYLNIETQYKGLRFIKRYLVIRHPEVQKTFTINVPEKEFKEIVEKAESIKMPPPTIKKPPEEKAPEVTKEKTPEVVVTEEKTPEVVVKEEAPKIPEEAPKSWWQRILDWIAEKQIPAVTKEAEIVKLKAPELATVAGEPPYILIIELEPGKILLIKQENEKYYGYINYFSGRTWYPIQEITYQEFKDLLEKGKIPPSFNL
jgi:hypothetical protein